MKSKKKPIAMLINDIHLDKDNGELVFDIFCQAVCECHQIGIDRIIIGGDIFTNRSGQPLSCLIWFGRIIEKCCANGIRLYAIAGNHDKTDSFDEKSYLDVFYGRCDFKCFSKGDFTWLDNCLIGFIPYFDDERWINEFNKIDKIRRINSKNSDSTFLITHIGIDGVMNNDGTKVESGIKTDIFNGWSKVLVGHYHNASSLGNNVVYTGSAYQNNYGETIDDKGFTIMYNDGSIDHIQSKFPKYIKHTFSVDDINKDEFRKIFDDSKNDSYNHTRFIFKGRRDELQKINASEFSKHGIDCKFESNESVEAINTSDSDFVMNYDKKSIISDFLQFCKENEIKGDAMKYGLNLIKKM